MTGNSADNSADSNRIARDYAIMRLEHIEAGNLSGYTEQDLRDLSSGFHSAQCRLLASVPKEDIGLEFQATKEFECKLADIRVRLRRLSFAEQKEVKSEQSKEVISAKLPKINIKPFDGKIENWISFIQLFNSLIHTKDIPNVEKLYYLLSSVQGPAYELIKNYPLTDENYIDAYGTLDDHYNKKCVISMTFYEKILTCEPIKSVSGTELHRVIQTFSENLSVLEKYGLPDKNFMLFHLLWSKLDKSLREKFQLEHNSSEVPKFEALQQFIGKHYQALSLTDFKSGTVNNSKPKPGNLISNKPKVNKSALVVSPFGPCQFCSKKHCLENCPGFLKLESTSRFDIIKKNGLCVLCFSPSHQVKECRAPGCGVCGSSHHTLLHFNIVKPPRPSEKINADSGEPVAPAVGSQPSTSGTTLTSMTPTTNVLFSTAKILIQGNNGDFKPIRVLLDSASACNFISESAAKSLGLSVNGGNHQVNGIGHSVAEPSGTVSCVLKPIHSRSSSSCLSVEALVLSSICADQPVQLVDSSRWSHIQGLVLADPQFACPGPVDMLLNADIFASSLLPGLKRGKSGQPIAMNTIFGWILLGGCDFNHNSRCRRAINNDCFLVQSSSNLSLDNSLKRFWELENIVPPNNILSKEEQSCETYFVENHSRSCDGRFVVPLPFVEPSDKPVFHGSRAIALKRFLSLEKKLDANADLKNAYVAFMDDYAACNHLEEVFAPSSDVGNFYYIPHHGVLRPESVSTPLRVVFDASAKDSHGLSLNDTLLVGPKLQTDIFDLLVRFRWHSVVFTGDVKQMYRQILVDAEDTDYQRILWRPSSDQPVQDFRLRTVTYGVSSAPYQALRTIAQLAKVSAAEFPLGASVLSRDIYVDDIVSGADSVAKALKLRSELTDILHSGGFHLRKWTSNSKDFLVDLPSSDLYSEEFRNFEDVSNISLKILGLLWSPHEDNFRFKVAADRRRCTKRTILSDIARIYDPLGLLGPVTFYAKYLMQLLWCSGVSWDDDAPENIASEWLRFKSQLSSLASVAFPRRVIHSFDDFQVHGFCDASERGYCAAVYFRVVHPNGEISVELCCSKTKVAPLKKLSIPRLELQAAVLLSDLLEAVMKALEPFYRIDKVSAWSDSTVALSWIKSCPSKWQTFVANRVAHVQDKLPSGFWGHVGTAENVADLGSRGTLPNEFVSKQDFWRHGPLWLSQPEDNWPTSSPSIDEDSIQKELKIFNLVTSRFDPDLVDSLIHKFSSFSKLQNVLAYCFRFLHNSKQNDPCKKIVGALQTVELNRAFNFLIKHVQYNTFSADIEHLKKGSPNSLSKGLRKLSLFIDDAGLVRVGGRLSRAEVSFDVKHPLLLPRNHKLTFLLIDEYHQKFMHPGAQTLQNLLFQSFWILSPKRAIRSVVSQCIKCFRAHPKQASAPVMGDLPSHRVNKIKPFSNVAIDYGGPFDISLGRGRGNKTFKAYICVFVCTSTKAIHIELASELSAEAFLAALKRFVARRGRCNNIISDQGRNFIGASNMLDKLLADAAESQKIKFSFNPPGSPHFNGLAEAGIKSVKTHLARVVGNQRLTYEEFATVLTQVEAMLNSRPLTPMSSDPHDLTALTPGHFLTLEPLTMVPESNLVDEKISVLCRWKLIQKMHQDFWRRWLNEYIHTLQQRTKWNKLQNNIRIGSLVLIANELFGPLKWSLGRIVALHPGSDGVCRVVTVKTATGQYKRPVVKLCPLPLI